MQDKPDNRKGPDRRRQPRGGRRAGDREGLSPLVLLVGNGTDMTHKSEAILAKLRFAVSTSEDVDHALRVLPDLRPDLVVADEQDEPRIREAASVPIVVMKPGPDTSVDTLIEDVLRTVRSRPATPDV
jgi:hypothetical protein